MIIVTGHLQVAAEDRSDYLDACREVVEMARATQGCLDFSLSADPLEPGRIIIMERWSSAEDLDAFRGDAPEGPDTAAIISADVAQYDIAAHRKL